MFKSWNKIAFTALILFTVLPLVAGLGYALLYSFGLTGALNKSFTTEHWQALFTDNTVLQSFFYSAAIAAVTVFVGAGIALWVALRHHQSFKKGGLSYLIYLPLSFPAMVAAFFFFQFLSKSGLLSRVFYNTGIINSLSAFPDLVNDFWGVGIITAHVFLCFPFFLLLFINRIETERVPEYLTLSSTLGASKKQSLWKIAVPMLLQKTLPNIIIYFIFIFGSYEIPVLLGRSDPEMISVLAVRKLQKFNLMDIPQGYAIAILYTVFVLLVIFLVFKKRRIAYDI